MALGQLIRKMGYVHFIPAARPDPKYPLGYELIQINSRAELRLVLEKYHAIPPLKRIIAWDTETNGFNHETCHIVGFSICFEPERAYYIPLRHVTGNNAEKECLIDLYDALLAANRAISYNRPFDHRMLANENVGDVGKIKHFDVMDVVWVADTNQRMPSLKWAAKHFLGWEMQDFAEVAGDDKQFAKVHPDDATPYAASDALSTFHLLFKTAPYYKKFRFSVDLDTKLADAVMHMEHTPTGLNISLLDNLEVEVSQRLTVLELEIINHVGYTFKINSTKQLVDALKHVGVETHMKTGKGAMSTKEEALDQIKDEHDVIKLIIEFKKLLKLQSSYISSLRSSFVPEIGGARFAYIKHAAPSARLAAGSERGNDYFANMNIQGVAKPEGAYYRVHYDSEHPDNILGWVYTQVPKERKNEPDVCEGYEPKRNVRIAFIPREGHYWVSMDYSGQELRIPAR